MDLPDINGAWFSENGELQYGIKQVGNLFSWETVHKNRVIEIGIGSLFEQGGWKAKAKWNCDGGNRSAPIRDDKGLVLLGDGQKAVKIEWNDKDHFHRMQ